VSPVKYELGFYIPEDGILHSHRRENLKSYIALTGWALYWRHNVSPVKYELGFYIPEDGILHSHRSAVRVHARTICYDQRPRSNVVLAIRETSNAWHCHFTQRTAGNCDSPRHILQSHRYSRATDLCPTYCVILGDDEKSSPESPVDRRSSGNVVPATKG
jgi:hypothetical protein